MQIIYTEIYIPGRCTSIEDTLGAYVQFFFLVYLNNAAIILLLPTFTECALCTCVTSLSVYMYVNVLFILFTYKTSTLSLIF